MSFDWKAFGKKIIESRESLLIEPSDVAEMLAITVDDYTNIELGKQPVSGDDIVRLATFFKRDFRFFVSGDYRSAESQIKEMFRQNSDLSKHDRIAIQEFSRLCEFQSLLEEVLQFSYEPLKNYSSFVFGHSHFKRQGAEVADFERKRLKLGQLPIRDIFHLLRGQGIKVFKRTLDNSNISGVYLNHPVAGHCILINYSEDLYRQNFSAAHEYGHALFDSEKQQNISYWNSSGQPEWRANSFAGNFLVPKERLLKDYSPAKNYDGWIELVVSIAVRFQVSSQVVIIRLNEMNWITKEMGETLLSDRRLRIKSEEKYDPEIPPDLPQGTKERFTKAITNGLSWHFLKLCAEAYRHGEITYHKALEMLLLPVEESIAIFNDISLFLEVSE